MAKYVTEHLNKEVTLECLNIIDPKVKSENLLKAFNEEFGRPINLHPEKQHQANIAKEQQKPQFNESNKQKEQSYQKPKGILVSPENRMNNHKKHVTFALPAKESNNKLIIKELSKFLTPENKLNNHKKHVTFALPAKENNNKVNIKELGSKVFNPRVETNNKTNHRSVKITHKIIPLKSGVKDKTR